MSWIQAEKPTMYNHRSQYTSKRRQQEMLCSTRADSNALPRMRRDYTDSSFTASGRWIPSRGPVVCGSGVRTGVAWACIGLLAFVLLFVAITLEWRVSQVSNSIDAHRKTQELLVSSKDTLEKNILAEENKLNVRATADQLGMVPCRDKQITYLTSPREAAVSFDEKDPFATLASAWGN